MKKKKKIQLKSVKEILSRDEMKKIKGGSSECVWNWDCPIGEDCCPMVFGDGVVFICTITC